MPNLDYNQTNFTAGEISPLMFGRVDFAKYKNGAKRLQNFLVKPQGGVVRRPGSQYVNNARQGGGIAAGVRMKNFTFSAGQAYALEFTDLKMRIYTAGERVESPPGTAVEVVTPWPASIVSQLTFAQSADEVFVACPGYAPQTISRLSNTSWTCAPTVFTDGPYLDAPNPATCPWLTAFSNGYDTCVLHIAPGGTTYVLNHFVEYFFDDAWHLAVVTGSINNGAGTCAAAINTRQEFTLPASVTTGFTFVGSWPSAGSSVTINSPYSVFSQASLQNYLRIDKDKWVVVTTINSASQIVGTVLAMCAYTALTNNIGLTSIVRNAQVNLTSGTAPFVALDVGRMIRLQLYGQWIWGTISSVNVGAGTMQIALGVPLPFDPANSNPSVPGGTTNIWRLGAWRTDTTLGACFPAALCLHQGRLCFGGTPDQPMTAWFSRGQDFLNFRPTEYGAGAVVADDDAITFTIADGQIDYIRWMVSGRYMMIGTGGAEYLINAGINSAAITPTTITVTKQSMHGSLNQHALFLDLSFVHVDRTGTRLDEMTYQYLQDSYVTTELTMLAEHIFTETNTQIQELAVQLVPTQIIWALGSDGSLYGCTRLRDQEVVAWHRHPLGANNSGAKVLSMCVIPSSNGTADTLYLAVQRNIGSANVIYIEILTPEYRATGPTDITKFIFGDASLSYSGAPATTISGLTHLIGETVQIVANGIYTGTQVVSGGGTVTVPSGTTTAHIGYSINSQIQTLNTEGGNPQGSSQGRISRVAQLVVRLYQSFGFYYGVSGTPLDNTTLRPWKYSLPSGVVYSPPQLKTGDTKVRLEQETSTDNTFCVSQTDPYPLTINSLMPELAVNIP